MIICLGTTPTVQRTMTFSQLTVNGVNRAAAVHEYASGKSTNAARVLHTLGDDVLATGFLGGDSGKVFRADLDRADIKHDFLDVEPATRLCITVVDQSGGTATELIEESKAVPPTDYKALLTKLHGHRARMDDGVIVLSGTLTPDAEPDFYSRCIIWARPNVKVVLDAVGEPLLRALTYRPYVIKPNQSEVGRTLSMDVDSEEALRRAMDKLVERGATWVVVTRGREGTLVTDGKAFWSVTTPAVNVVSAIGSGDSFAAGLASALARGDEVPHACIRAAACGSANAMTPYAGHVNPTDVAALEQQIRVTEAR